MRRGVASPARLLAAALLALASAALPPAAAAAQEEAPPRAFDLGPLAARDRTLEGAERLRAAGPLFECQTDAEGRRFLALRPFYSRVEDPSAGHARREYLWPVGACRDLRWQRLWWFLVAYGQNFDTRAPARERRVIFPVFWSGSDRSNRTYTAVFPLGGEIRGFFWMERVWFVLFPLYSESVAGDIRGHSVLWPFIGWANGEDTHRLRVFPFYGRAEKRGRWVRHFVLWPVWSSVRYTDERDRGRAFVLFPLVGRVDTAREQTWMWLPPFFRFSRGEHDYRAVNCPWPFFQRRLGRGEDRLYLWPLWGRKREPGRDTAFALWPVFSRGTVRRPEETIRSARALPFFFAESRRDPSSPRGKCHALYWKLWPLVSYRRDGGAARVRLLELWPGRDLAPLERNYAPLWTLYSRVSAGAALDEEFLWGLYRFRRAPEGARLSVFPLYASRSDTGAGTSEWNVLGGLAGARRDTLRRELRLLYFLRLRIGGAPAERDGGKTHPSP
jgi:hypothetical protein